MCIAVVQSCFRTAKKDDKCATVPSLKPNECSGLNCTGLPMQKWRKIKCLPFSSSGRIGLWCDRIASFFCGGGTRPCIEAFKANKSSSNQIYNKISTEKFIFEAEHCRFFEFVIKKKSRDPDYSCTVGNLNHSNKINIKDAKKQFGASIRSTWCSSPGTVETSSMDQKLQDIFFAAFILEESLLSFGSNQLNGTNPEFLDFDEDLNFQIRHNALQKGNDFLFNGSNGENFIKIPQANLDQHSVVLGLAYNDLSDLLSNYSADTDEEGNKTRILDSIIMSAVIDPQPEFLTENVTLVFKNKKADRKNRTCVFWSFSKDRFGGWSSEGCQTNMIFDNQTECVCNHMTHFAVLMDFADNSADGKDKTRSSDEHGKILTILTQVGMALSLTGVVLTVIGYTQLTDRHSPLCHIRVSLTSCIGAGHVIFFAGIDATENKAVCVAVAALLQYFLMASFSWMLIEGIYIYLFVVKVYNIADKIFRYHGFCWGKVQYHS
ncbi:adhesion G protein-coupled receptor E2-like [Stylophora pistillata]|uniref:adhesion G protein-coupled receptor E2-like n=1 Tax=Stylophora pistillata TaxID=50429 RepID=UPI000C054FC7|nr:adhesion G protein-coupled receptor E2-like [Stylophora pistillata]